ncbi:hypothetical protein TpMuguga_03g00193 [Theileria parva strain Muguga]|uniref:Uncharacterized protein n=1 Tax=Theileria parva TaxID=5875 RepID=Q4N0F1_THEPA|nr:uncharacterized protein TpMuguga_03g00193 [Theileria parva strain Muguga]EAN30928.1 hypothetical protein TpMuguga_03g00193 [Theileria parva strain Muguga]|eukprot:XP_763211.1 hypothetical protein [Theileria parva strain Muguga]
MSVTFFPIINNPMDLTAEPDHSPDTKKDISNNNSSDNSDNVTDEKPYLSLPINRWEVNPKEVTVEVKSFITMDCHAVKLDISKAIPTRKTEWWTGFNFGDFIRPYNQVYGLVVDGDQVIWKSTKPNECGLKVELFYLLNRPDMVIILLENLGLHISQKYKCEECEKLSEQERRLTWAVKGGCERCWARDEWVDVTHKFFDPFKLRFYPEDGGETEKQPMDYDVSLKGYNYEIELKEPCAYLTYGDRILFSQRGKTKGTSITKINYHIVYMTLRLKLTDGRTLERRYEPENEIQPEPKIETYEDEEIYNVTMYCKDCTTKDRVIREAIKEPKFKIPSSQSKKKQKTK